MHPNAKRDFIKFTIVFCALILSSYLVYARWQRGVQIKFCQKMQACYNYREFAEYFRSFDLCWQSQEGINERLKFEACDRNLDCQSWLVCGYGVETMKKSPFDNRKSDFKQIQSDIDPNAYRE